MSEEGQTELVPQRSLQVPFPSSPINCMYYTKNASDLSRMDASLVFTHGAGGDLQSDAIANFAHGFAAHSRQSSILCFQGNANLKSRVKMFNEVIHSDLNVRTPRCLGGRSMGARAAVAVIDNTTHLVLVSYPLQTATIREKVLLDLPASVKVIFVSGDRDKMCDLEKLEEVRRKMSCQTWRVVVENADHGMNVKPKAGTREVGKKTGDVVAMWLNASDPNLREGKIVWSADEETAQWSGWYAEGAEPETNAHAPITPSSGTTAKKTTAKNLSTGKRKRDST